MHWHGWWNQMPQSQKMVLMKRLVLLLVLIGILPWCKFLKQRFQFSKAIFRVIITFCCIIISIDYEDTFCHFFFGNFLDFDSDSPWTKFDPKVKYLRFVIRGEGGVNSQIQTVILFLITRLRMQDNDTFYVLLKGNSHFSSINQ